MQCAEYIWIDGKSPTATLRSKTRVGGALGDWSFDGSSTYQAQGSLSDCVLRPVRTFDDPIRKQFQGESSQLVLCEVLNSDGTPHPSNYRARLRQVLDAAPTTASLAWFGFEQEYTLFKGSRPLGFGEDRRFPAAQGPYYCGVGADEVFGRDLVEDHLSKCLAAGIKITGINAEVMPGQWEFQVGGPDQDALTASDHLWVARWLLYRLGEQYGIHATLDPKPVPGDWNGAGMHTNFSTAQMRGSRFDEADMLPGPFGMKAIEQWCSKARGRVTEHLAAYGDGIEMRLTGKHETCSYKEFRWGVSDRTASIRIPLAARQTGSGYLEDRRPNANACPYRVAAAVLSTEYDLWPQKAVQINLFPKDSK